MRIHANARTNNLLEGARAIVFLECGGLAPLWYAFRSDDVPLYQSGARPTHSKKAICVQKGLMSKVVWQENLIDDGPALRDLLTTTKSIAVLGIKTEAQSYQPAFYVPRYLQSAGF